MPIREYECTDCGFKTERIEHTPDSTAIYCPRCLVEGPKRVEMTKVQFSRTAFKLDGSGWAKDGYADPRPVRGDRL